jgi:hypothetical protein
MPFNSGAEIMDWLQLWAMMKVIGMLFAFAVAVAYALFMLFLIKPWRK